jgi:hypothetical protein
VVSFEHLVVFADAAWQGAVDALRKASERLIAGCGTFLAAAKPAEAESGYNG